MIQKLSRENWNDAKRLGVPPTNNFIKIKVPNGHPSYTPENPK